MEQDQGQRLRVDQQFPMSQVDWGRVVARLELSPQQARIVYLILQGKKDKQIAQEMDLTVPTVRTYLGRIFDRVGVDGRVGLAVKVFSSLRPG